MKSRNIYLSILAVWLFVMMAVPSFSTSAKLMLMAAFLLAAFIAEQKMFVSSRMLAGVLIWELFFTGFYANSILNGFQFDPVLVEVYLIRPAVLLLMTGYMKNKVNISFMFKILLAVCGVIVSYNVYYVLQEFGLLPAVLHNENTQIEIRSSFITIRTINLTALMFLTPFMISLFFNSSRFPVRTRRIIYVLTITSFLVSLISGRRALQLIAIGILVFYLFIRVRKLKLPVKQAAGMFGILMILLVTVTVLSSLSGLNVPAAVFNTIKAAFDTMQHGGSVRKNQIIALYLTWKQKMLFGHGLSAYSEEYSRYSLQNFGHTATGWSYELFYNALLMQIGIAGVIFVAFYIFNIGKKLFLYYKTESDRQLGAVSLAVLTGFAGFLICGASNPLVTSSWMWFIVLSMYAYITGG